jgi:hypothetical protein
MEKKKHLLFGEMGEGLRVRSTLIFPSEENQLPFSLRSSLLPRNPARSGFIGDSSPSNPHPFNHLDSRMTSIKKSVEKKEGFCYIDYS